RDAATAPHQDGGDQRLGGSLTSHPQPAGEHDAPPAELAARQQQDANSIAQVVGKQPAGDRRLGPLFTLRVKG
ncbi:MAG: hypothetical protein ACYCVA_05745, partial [Sulfobacillus sp.]